MKKSLSLILYYIFLLISCSSIEEINNVTDEKIVEIILETENRIIEIIPTPDMNLTRDLLETIDTQEILPNIELFDLIIEQKLPIDPILKIIELKKRYYIFNNIKESDFEDSLVTAIYAENNKYFIGTLRGGVLEYNLQNKTNHILIKPRDSLFNISITGFLLFDDQLLISSYSGLFIYKYESDEMVFIPSSTNGDGILSMCRVGNKVIMGTVHGRLFSWNKFNLSLLTTINNTPINVIRYLNNYLILGTSGKGVLEYSLLSNEIHPIVEVNSKLNGNKISLLAYFDERYWVGSLGDGLYTFNNRLGNCTLVYDSDWILNSAQSDHFIYFGTHSEGLLIYDENLDKWNNWGLKEGLPSLYIPTIYFNDENIFISTADRGIVIINEKIHKENL